jgi:Zn finger protein HypA/HybF involved in hydrogenase expression
MSVINEAEAKYSKDGPFVEPVVRCDKCNEIVQVQILKRLGMCPHCSNTRVRNVRTLSEEEVKRVQGWVDIGEVDPDWIKLFEPQEVSI